MNITRAAIEKKRITIVTLLLIFLGGIQAFFQMPRAEDPGFIVRMAMIITNFPGASPERVDLLVTDELEKAIQEIPEIDYLKSESRTGLSIIQVYVKDEYTEMRPIWDDLRLKVEKASDSLPNGVGQPVVNDDMGDVFGMLIAITGEGYSPKELKTVADSTRNVLLTIEDVARVDIQDNQEERIFVSFDPQTLMKLELTPYQLKDILSKQNIVQPGGKIFTSDEQIMLEPNGSFENITDLGNTSIRSPATGEVMFLKDFTVITRGYIDPSKAHASYNGETALVLAISMKEGGNIINVGDSIRDKMAQTQQASPIGLDFHTIYFQPDFVKKKIGDFLINIIQAIVIVMAVMLLFLGLRTGLVIASLIPTAMVAALWVMSLAGIGLDQMSLASLIIALGMLVDNAVVMTEAIMTGMSEGKKALDAAVEATRELAIPLLTSSLTTAAAFLPIYLAQSTTGEYTSPLFLVVTITLLCSWALSLTMIPLFSVLFLKVTQNREVREDRISRVYSHFIQWALHYPRFFLALTLLVFLGSLQLFPFVPKLFFPPNDKAVMSIALTLPQGTPLSKTREVVENLESFIKAELSHEEQGDDSSEEGIVDWVAFVGHGSPKYQLSYNPEPNNPNYAYFLCNTSNREIIDTKLTPRIQEYCDLHFPDAIVKAAPLAQGAPVEAPVQVRISGQDVEPLFQLVKTIKETFQEIPGLCNIKDDWGRQQKKIKVDIDGVRAQRAGLSNQDIAISLQTLLTGMHATDFRENENAIPVMLRANESDRTDIDALKSHPVQAQAIGHTVPLNQVAALSVVFEPSKIKRRNRLKTVTIDAELLEGYNAAQISNEVESLLVEMRKTLPPGFYLEQGGERETSGKAQDSITVKLPIAGMMIVFLLILQFDSIRRPIIILLTIPLGLIGVISGLLITGQPFGFMALLGLISLAGIIINNAIVLIDRIDLEINDLGRSPYQAIQEAARRRLRPILLTTLTTVGGLIPLWLGGGPLFESMAVAILFGLVFATVITLGFVPVCYAIFFGVKRDSDPKQNSTPL